MRIWKKANFATKLIIVCLFIPFIALLFEQNTNTFGIIYDFWTYHGDKEVLAYGAQIYLLENMNHTSFRLDLYLLNVLFIIFCLLGVEVLSDYRKGKLRRK